ncbi:MAG: anthranilate synthase component I [Mariprofundaceae bacterium]
MKLFRRTLSSDCDTPVSVFSRLRGEGECFLFESAEGGEHWGRYSIIGVDPVTVATESKENTLHLRHRDSPEEVLQGMDMIAWLRNEVVAIDAINDADDLPFSGGAVGYFGYDIVHRFEPGVTPSQTSMAAAAYMLVDRFVVIDNLKCIMHLCVLEKDEKAAQRELDAIALRLQQGGVPAPMRFDLEQDIPAPKSGMPQESYESMVERAKAYILAGDIFQVVLSQRFSSPLACDPLSIYRAVRHINPSPYLFYMQIDGVTLIGSSPEILVRKEGTRAIVRPLAGTRPRGSTVEEDVALEQSLLADEKECAEHVMLVDLGRNDLGRVCNYGSVSVTESMRVERYSHVMHIVSQVEGELRDHADALTLLAATFPAGTLSGAPKVRAMQIIEELEPEARGPYGGCIGHISFGGEKMDTAIIIRTAVVRDNMVHVQAGAGIVADSVPEREHQECVNKATAMFRSVALAQSQESQS